MKIENLNKSIIKGIRGYSNGYSIPSRGDIVIMKEQCLGLFEKRGFSETNPPDLHTYQNILTFVTEKFNRDYSA